MDELADWYDLLRLFEVMSAFARWSAGGPSEVRDWFPRLLYTSFPTKDISGEVRTIRGVEFFDILLSLGAKKVKWRIPVRFMAERYEITAHDGALYCAENTSPKMADLLSAVKRIEMSIHADSEKAVLKDKQRKKRRPRIRRKK